ncbi:hypothetical protein MMC22_011656 [Lobaria immixta]|nr:hypothetical protein [Lobaria immixta]
MTALLTPGSPTLTNPDMILPYGSRSSAAATSTPRDLRHFSTHSSNSGSPTSGDDGDENMRRGVRRLFGNGVKSQREGLDLPVQTDVSKEGGRPGEPKQTHYSGRTGENRLLASSPTLHDNYDHRSSSNAGSDEISNGYWKGFDGPIIEMVTGTHHSHDQASLTGRREPRDEGSTPDHKEQGLRTILDEDENDPNSHAAMSKRAEQILANAKKRLLTMENNLNRARSGLNNRPSSSMSSFLSHEREPVSLYTIPGLHKGTDGLAPSRHRQGNTQLHASGGKGHSRVFSESAVPSSLQTEPRIEESVSGGTPSSSGLNATDMGLAQVTPGEQGSGTSRNWFWTGLNRNGGSAGRLNNAHALEPLQEDEPAPTSFDSHSHTSSPHSTEHQPHIKSDQQSSDGSSLDLEKTPSNGLTRARSTTQMRDLRDQMQDLKGKISSLKQRAREDSMRRRSLQSLRTPSPFTAAAEQWYTGSPGHQLGNTTIITSNGRRKRSRSFGPTKATEDELIEPRNIQSTEQANSTHDEKDNSVHDHQARANKGGDIPIGILDNSHSFTHESSIQEEKEADKSNGDTSTLEGSDGSLDDLLDNREFDPSSSPIGERHEDRPDAFDYENFYLHSGMGHFARRQDSSRSSSHSSIYSVETAKPFNDVVEEFNNIDDDNYRLHAKASDGDLNSRLNGHVRQNSGESVSTLATFATATEGGGGDEVTEEEEWTNGSPMAGSWQPDYPSKRKFHLDNRNAPTSHTSRNNHEHRVIRSSPSAMDDAGSAGEDSTPTQSFTRLATPPPTTPQSPIDVLSAFSALKGGTPAKAIQLGDGDKELVERLIQSLSKVCVELHAGDVEGGKYENRVWRRRLDAARRVLEGEVNGEAF